MSSSDELTLRDLFSIFRHRKKELFICWVATFFAVAVYTAWLTPQYRAQVLLKVRIPDEMGHAIEVGPFNIIGGSANAFNIDSLLTPETAGETLRQLGKLQGKNERETGVLMADLLRRTRIQ